MKKEIEGTITTALLTWYKAHKRDLPWRRTRDPYLIWLSEIILQQTRIDQGLEYYLKFAEAYPDVGSLARASEDEVLKLWQGLGYYSRARNLLFSANQIMQQFNGQLPGTYADLLKLKGVGEYTAAAIASIAYGESVPVLDGNVFRVLSRWFGISSPIETSAGKREFFLQAQSLIRWADHPGDFNQAMMEFGALQCVPRNPDCSICPFTMLCVALADDRIHELPVKLPKARIRKRYLHYFLPEGKRIFLQKRASGDVWQGLYEFPLIETPGASGTKDLLDRLQPWGRKIRIERIGEELKHLLVHQEIHARFWRIHGEITIQPCWLEVALEEVQKYPVSRLIERFMQTSLCPENSS